MPILTEFRRGKKYTFLYEKYTDVIDSLDEKQDSYSVQDLRIQNERKVGIVPIFS